LKLTLSAQDVAFVAVFAAFSAIVIKILPGIPVVGVPDASIKLDAAMAPIYGLILGPYLGSLAALIGGFVTAGSAFDILTSFCPAVSALMAGFLTRRNLGNNEGKIKGWMIAALVLGLLILGWYLTGVGQRAPFYPILHVAGFILIFATGERTAKAYWGRKVEGKNSRVKPPFLLGGIMIMVVAYMFTQPYSSELWIIPYLSLPMFFVGGIMIVYGLFGNGRSSFALAVTVASYCGIIADHMLGNLIFICSVNVFIPLSDIEPFLTSRGLPDIPSLFMYMIPVSALERVLFTAIAMTIGVGLILALRRANLSTRKL
jgi:uncharacterized membrane protein